MPDGAPAARLAALLEAWYRPRRADLPWRRLGPDPYAVLVSEAMLQQTQVETVRPYFERFMARFPTAASLAAAAEGEVLALWQGLGYYRRARQLMAAARIMALCWPSEPPRSVADLRRLPGVGPYVAGAMAAIAFGWPEAAVDGNAVRVIARLDDLPGPRDAPELHRRVAARAAALARAATSAGDAAQALMDLGRTVCRPRAPRCDLCPVADHCLSRLAGRQAERPAPPARRPVVRQEDWQLAVAVDGGGAVLAAPRPDGLLGGMWGLPAVAATAAQGWAGLRRELVEAWGVRPVGDPWPLGHLTQRYTHRLWRAEVWATRVEGRPRRDGARYLGASERAEVGFANIFRRALALWQAAALAHGGLLDGGDVTGRPEAPRPDAS
jgi:A/G-specific adenine glycosylase